MNAEATLIHTLGLLRAYDQVLNHLWDRFALEEIGGPDAIHGLDRNLNLLTDLEWVIFRMATLLREVSDD